MILLGEWGDQQHLYYKSPKNLVSNSFPAKFLGSMLPQYMALFVTFVCYVSCVQNNPCMLPSLISGIFVIQEAAAPKQGVEFCQKCGGWCEI